jgi:Neprosin
MLRTTITYFPGRLSRLMAAAAISAIAAGAVIVAEAGPAAAAPAGGAPVFSYVGEAYQATARGASAVLPVARPRLARQADHSLAELAVESADRRDIVETGWVRSQGIAGGPRLFVSYWANGVDHVDAGFALTSRTDRPFEALRPGASARFGLAYAGGRWNVSYGGHVLGYFPGRLWAGRFRAARTTQAFGEVESYGHSRTQMIDGRADRAVSGFRLIGARTPAGQFYGSPGDGYYLGAHGAGWFRLGGPGRA